MSKRGVYAIGEHKFPNRTAAAKTVSRILQSATLNTELGLFDAPLVSALFGMHPNALEKAPDGAVAHLVRMIEFRPGIVQRCFFAVRPGGSQVDWSYRVAMGLAPSGPTLQEAAREAIYPDIAAYKASRYGTADAIPCDLTGAMIPFAEAHVDHAPPWPFVEIMRAYVRERGAPALRGREPWGCDFVDPAERDAFIAFHHERAVLRILDGKVNIGRGARA
jgi:hypothetical protein